MPSLKRPLFLGNIQPVHIGIGASALTDVFTPPDSTSKAPQTYELHLWLLPQSAAGYGLNLPTYALLASEGPPASATKIGTLWSGKTGIGGFAIPRPIKILDGYPIRGNVSVTLLASAAAGVDPYPIGPQLWGYYLPAGQGSKVELEHRFIGNIAGLAAFNSGVPDSFVASAPPGTPGTSKIIHVFQKGRIDEISLAFAASGDPVVARVTFEDVANNPIIPGHYVDFRLVHTVGDPAVIPTATASPQGHILQTPYMLSGVPFGGVNPLLDHIRVTAIPSVGPSGSAFGVHGFFIRH
jgi:hypothetical protein